MEAVGKMKWDISTYVDIHLLGTLKYM